MLVIGEAGCGKSFLAEAVAVELVDAGFTVAKTKSGTVKQVFLHLAAQLGVDSESIEGKSLKTEELADAIAAGDLKIQHLSSATTPTGCQFL